jgi:hypothetical protein
MTPDGSWKRILSVAPDGEPMIFLSGQAAESVGVYYVAAEHSEGIYIATTCILQPKARPEPRAGQAAE